MRTVVVCGLGAVALVSIGLGVTFMRGGSGSGSGGLRGRAIAQAGEAV